MTNIDIDRIARYEAMYARRPTDALRARIDQYRANTARNAAIASLIENHADELTTLTDEHTAVSSAAETAQTSKVVNPQEL